MTLAPSCSLTLNLGSGAWPWTPDYIIIQVCVKFQSILLKDQDKKYIEAKNLVYHYKLERFTLTDSNALFYSLLYSQVKFSLWLEIFDRF